MRRVLVVARLATKEYQSAAPLVSILLTGHGSLPLCEVRRTVAGVHGRGDLFYQNHSITERGNRNTGPVQGMVNWSQSVQPQTGQLHFRKRVMHAQNKAGRSTSALLCPAIAKWSYLIPSLQQGIRQGIPDTLYSKLVRTESEDATEASSSGSAPFSPAGSAVTEAERRRMRDAHRLFHYELHQRLPLLEDALAEAELQHLVAWPALFHRAWVVLPGTPDNSGADTPSEPTPARGPAPRSSLSSERSQRNEEKADSGKAVVAAASSCAPLPCLFRELPSRSARREACDFTSWSNQIFSLTSRVAALTVCVQQCVEAQRTLYNTTTGEGRPSRQRERQAALFAQWDAEMAWHARQRGVLVDNAGASPVRSGSRLLS